MATKKATKRATKAKSAKGRGGTSPASRLPKADKSYLPPSYYARGNHGDA